VIADPVDREYLLFAHRVRVEAAGQKDRSIQERDSALTQTQEGLAKREAALHASEAQLRSGPSTSIDWKDRLLSLQLMVSLYQVFLFFFMSVGNARMPSNSSRLLPRLERRRPRHYKRLSPSARLRWRNLKQSSGRRSAGVVPAR
jgi:hypothetical protein